MKNVVATAQRHRRSFGHMVGAVAVLSALVALFFGIGNLLFQVRSEPATGSVLALETLKGPDGQVQVPVRYSVKIRYTDVEGREHVFIDPRPSATPPAIGEDVPLLYKPEHPESARIRNYLVIYREAIFFGVGAVLAGIVAEELLRRQHRLPPPHHSE